MDKIAEILQAAKNLVESGWCRGALSMDEKSQAVKPESGKAKYFSAIGAICRVMQLKTNQYRPTESSVLYREVINVFRDANNIQCVAMWNDSMVLDKKVILQSFENAIKYALKIDGENPTDETTMSKINEWYRRATTELGVIHGVDLHISANKADFDHQGSIEITVDKALKVDTLSLENRMMSTIFKRMKSILIWNNSDLNSALQPMTEECEQSFCALVIQAAKSEVDDLGSWHATPDVDDRWSTIDTVLIRSAKYYPDLDELFKFSSSRFEVLGLIDGLLVKVDPSKNLDQLEKHSQVMACIRRMIAVLEFKGPDEMAGTSSNEANLGALANTASKLLFGGTRSKSFKREIAGRAVDLIRDSHPNVIYKFHNGSLRSSIIEDLRQVFDVL